MTSPNESGSLRKRTRGLKDWKRDCQNFDNDNKTHTTDAQQQNKKAREGDMNKTDRPEKEHTENKRNQQAKTSKRKADGTVEKDRQGNNPIMLKENNSVLQHIPQPNPRPIVAPKKPRKSNNTQAKKTRMHGFERDKKKSDSAGNRSISAMTIFPRRNNVRCVFPMVGRSLFLFQLA